MGPVPLSWLEMEAWARVTGRTLQPWEYQFIRRLSIEWIAQSEDSKDPSCPAPWGEITPQQRRAAAMSLRAEMRALAK